MYGAINLLFCCRSTISVQIRAAASLLLHARIILVLQVYLFLAFKRVLGAQLCIKKNWTCIITH